MNYIHSASTPVQAHPFSYLGTPTYLLPLTDTLNYLKITSSPVDVLPSHYLKAAVAQALNVINDSSFPSDSVSEYFKHKDAHAPLKKYPKP